jgi:hypothetical protein
MVKFKHLLDTGDFSRRTKHYGFCHEFVMYQFKTFFMITTCTKFGKFGFYSVQTIGAVF